MSSNQMRALWGVLSARFMPGAVLSILCLLTQIIGWVLLLSPFIDEKNEVSGPGSHAGVEQSPLH